MIVFITFKIIPWTHFVLLLLSFGVFFDAGKLQIAQFLWSFFLFDFNFFLSLKFQKHQQKHEIFHISFFLSFFFFFFFFSSHISLLLRLLTCHLSFLFSFDVASYKSHDTFFLSFFFHLIFSFFKDYNKKRQTSHLPFFLIILCLQTHNGHIEQLCFILLGNCSL